MSRARELNDYLAAVEDDSDNVRAPLPSPPARALVIPDDERVFLRLIEWARTGREVFKAEAKGDHAVKPSELIALAEGRGHE